MVEFAGGFLFVFRSSRTRSSPHVVRRRRGDGAGAYRDGASLGHPTESNRSAGSVATWLSGPPRFGGGKRSPFFVLYYVDHEILVELQWRPDGRCCRRASASLASDQYRLFRVRSSRDPTLLAPHKISLWDTQLCVLGWDIDTVAMTISVPLEKLERLRDTLNEWSPDRVVASEEELRSLIGRLLHLCEVVRPGKYFVRRMLNQAGPPPARAWSAKYHASHTRAAPSPRIHLGPEFHADASFWRLLVEGGLGSPAGRLSARLYRSFLQTFTLWSDASGDAMGYFFGPRARVRCVVAF